MSDDRLKKEGSLKEEEFMLLGRDFMRAVRQIEQEKGLPMDLIISSLEAALVSAYKKYKGSSRDMKVEIDPAGEGVSVYELRKVVEQPSENAPEISLEAARRLGHDDAKIGDEIWVEIAPEEFGRIAAQTARQVIIQRLRDAERQIVYDEFADRVGDLVTGIVFKSEDSQVLVRINDRTDAMLPPEERIPGEKYQPGGRMKFYLLNVRQTTRGPRIVLSRTHPGLVKRLMELEIPEIKEGVVEIKGIVREAGARSKVAVASLDPNVDPVGACVGNKGQRTKSISEELAGERLDIVVWSNNPLQFIKNALSPAKVVKVEPNLEQDKAVHAYVRPDHHSLAIGKGGQNVRLAAKLTGWKIDIKVLEPERMPTLHDLFADIIKKGND